MNVTKRRSQLETIVRILPTAEAGHRGSVVLENGLAVKIFERRATGTKATQHVMRNGHGRTGNGGLGSVWIEENERVVVLGVGKEEVVDEATELAHVRTNGSILQDAGAQDGNPSLGGRQVHPRKLSTATLLEKLPVGILPDLLVMGVLLGEARHGGCDCEFGGCDCDCGIGITRMHHRREVIFLNLVRKLVGSCGRDPNLWLGCGWEGYMGPGNIWDMVVGWLGSRSRA